MPVTISVSAGGGNVLARAAADLEQRFPGLVDIVMSAYESQPAGPHT